MPRKPRIHYTETDKAVMWDRWQKGDSLESIAQLFDRTHGSVARILRQTGGIQGDLFRDRPNAEYPGKPKSSLYG